MKSAHSCSMLPCSSAQKPAVVVPDFPVDSSRDARGHRHAPKHAAHMSGRYTLLTGNLAEIRQVPIIPSERVDTRDKLGVQIDVSDAALIYSKPNNVSNKIIPSRLGATVPPSLGEAVFKLRKSLGYSQAELAGALSVSQGNVAKWENGKLKPPGQILALLARLAPAEEASWWLMQAGVMLEHFSAEEADTRTIPVLKDAAAAGTPRIINDEEIDFRLKLPRHMIPRGGNLVGVTVSGESMSPILEHGYLALIDTSKRDAAKLVDKMVAAREGDGITIKWLRQNDDLYLLVPQNTSPRHPVHVMRPEGDWSIVGEVVKWIGEPPHLSAKRK